MILSLCRGLLRFAFCSSGLGFSASGNMWKRIDFAQLFCVSLLRSTTRTLRSLQIWVCHSVLKGFGCFSSGWQRSFLRWLFTDSFTDSQAGRLRHKTCCTRVKVRTLSFLENILIVWVDLEVILVLHILHEVALSHYLLGIIILLQLLTAAVCLVRPILNFNRMILSRIYISAKLLRWQAVLIGAILHICALTVVVNPSHELLRLRLLVLVLELLRLWSIKNSEMGVRLQRLSIWIDACVLVIHIPYTLGTSIVVQRALGWLNLWCCQVGERRWFVCSSCLKIEWVWSVHILEIYHPLSHVLLAGFGHLILLDLPNLAPRFARVLRRHSFTESTIPYDDLGLVRIQGSFLRFGSGRVLAMWAFSLIAKSCLWNSLNMFVLFLDSLSFDLRAHLLRLDSHFILQRCLNVLFHNVFRC